jgi:hypothetical protein
MNAVERSGTRILAGGVMAALAATLACAADAPAAGGAADKSTSAVRDGQHDFDFEIGTWHTHVRRLLHPLSGSTSWAEYDGTSVVRKVWGGRANLLELRMDGPSGHFEGLSLRLYNPQAHQWSLNFSNAAAGTMATPTIGEFREGRGEFYDQETLGDRAIFVRFVISDIRADSARFEQSYSADGGKNWEVNWIATDTRVKDAAANSSRSEKEGLALAKRRGNTMRRPLTNDEAMEAEERIRADAKESCCSCLSCSLLGDRLG